MPQASGRAADIGDRVLNSVVAQSLGFLGDRWTLLTIRDLFLGRHRFEALLSHTGAVRSTLANRLKILVEQGVVYRNPYQGSPPRYEYRLTPKGLGLYDFALSLWSWELRWLSKDVLNVPPTLYHNVCDSFFQPVCACERCGQTLEPLSVTSHANPSYVVHKGPLATSKRRSKVKVSSHKATDGSLFHVTDILGDRWNNLILGCALYGLKRYDDFQHALGISSNILADRLKLLVEAELFARVQYQSMPARYQYDLTAKGLDYLPVAMALHKWGDRWLTQGQGGNVVMMHDCAKEPLKFRFICSHCNQPLKPHDVSAGQRNESW